MENELPQYIILPREYYLQLKECSKNENDAYDSKLNLALSTTNEVYTKIKNTLEFNIDTLFEEIQAQKSEITRWQKKVCVYKMRFANAEDDVQILRTSQKIHQNAVKELTEKLGSCEQYIALMKSTFERSSAFDVQQKEQIQRLQSDLASKTAEYDILKKFHENASSASSSKDLELKILAEKYSSINSEYKILQESILKEASAFQSTRTELASTQKKLAEVTANVHALQKATESDAATIHCRDEEILTLKSQIEALKRSSALLQQANTSLKTFVAETNEQMVTLTHEQLERERNRSGVEREGFLAQIQELSVKLRAAEEARSHSAESSVTQWKEVVSLQARLAKSEAEAAELRMQTTEGALTLQEIKTKLMAAQQKIAEQEDESVETRRVLESKITSLQKQLASQSAFVTETQEAELAREGYLARERQRDAERESLFRKKAKVAAASAAADVAKAIAMAEAHKEEAQETRRIAAAEKERLHLQLRAREAALLDAETRLREMQDKWEQQSLTKANAVNEFPVIISPFPPKQTNAPSILIESPLSAAGIMKMKATEATIAHKVLVFDLSEEVRQSGTGVSATVQQAESLVGDLLSQLDDDNDDINQFEKTSQFSISTNIANTYTTVATTTGLHKSPLSEQEDVPRTDNTYGKDEKIDRDHNSNDSAEDEINDHQWLLSSVKKKKEIVLSEKEEDKKKEEEEKEMEEEEEEEGGEEEEEEEERVPEKQKIYIRHIKDRGRGEDDEEDEGMTEEVKAARSRTRSDGRGGMILKSMEGVNSPNSDEMDVDDEGERDEVVEEETETGEETRDKEEEKRKETEETDRRKDGHVQYATEEHSHQVVEYANMHMKEDRLKSHQEATTSPMITQKSPKKSPLGNFNSFNGIQTAESPLKKKCHVEKMAHLLEHVVELPMKEFPSGIVDSDVENGMEMEEGEEEEEKEEKVEEKEGETTEEEKGYGQDSKEERGDEKREQIIVQKSVNQKRKGTHNKRESDEEEEMQCFLNYGKPVEEEKVMEGNEESEMEMSEEKEKGNSDADDINIVKEDLKKTSRATYREVRKSIISKRVTEVEETPLSTRGPITSTSSADPLLPCTVPATVPSPPPLEKIQLVLVDTKTKESVQDKKMKGDDVGGDVATSESHGRKGKGSKGSKRIVASQRKSSKKAEIGKGDDEKGGIAPDSATTLPPSLSLLPYSSRADAPPAPSSPPPSPPPPPPPAFSKPVDSIRVPSVLPTAMINTTNTTGAFMKPPPTLSTPVNAIVDGFGRSGGIKIPSPSTSSSTMSSFSSQRFSASSSLSLRPPPSSSSSLGRLQLPNGMQLPKVQISLNPLVLQAAKLRRQFVSPLTVASMQPIHRPQNTGDNDSVKKSGIKRKASSLFASKSSFPRLG